jgi:hypothetical protein
VLVKLRDELTGLPVPASDGSEGAKSHVRDVRGVHLGSTAANGNGNGARKPATTTGAQLASDIVVSLRLRVGDAELAFFSTIATFGTAVDVTISELAIESFFPADRATADYLQRT